MDAKQEAIDTILSGRVFRMGDWETVKAIAAEAYDAGKRAAEAPEEPLAYWEVTLLGEPEPVVTEHTDMASLYALPDGTRVKAANRLVYTKVEGEWRHDVVWREWGTDWCDCGRFPLSDDLPATVLTATKEDN